MKIEVVEILLVLGIVGVQVYVFLKTYRQIQLFKNIIPEIHNLKVTKLNVPIADLQRMSPKEILAGVEEYKKNAHSHSSYIPAGAVVDGDDEYVEEYHQNGTPKEEVNIIEAERSDNPVFQKILFSLNNYLVRNRGAATDFNLIKDIVQRNTEAVEEDINTSIGVPLYLGLMGTMIGIVIGLFNMPDLDNALDPKLKDSLLNEGIALLIGGVKIAMIASFIGLLFTIINSGWTFKGSRSHCEARKNELYTFFQMELLPIINQGLASTLESLQRNLMRFNSEFSSNLKGLTGIFDASRSAVREQKELLDALDKAKVSDMTRYNVAVLKQLDVSVNQFEKFNSYLTNVTQFVDNSQQIVSRTNELLSRTDNFKTIADGLGSKIDQSHQLLEFLSSHFKKLEEHREYTSNAVADVGFAIKETFDELKGQILTSSENIKQFTVDETELLKKALSESKTGLSNLEHLSTLRTELSQFKNSALNQGESVKHALDSLNTNLARSIAVLEQIEQSSLSNRAKGLTKSIKNLFASKR